MAPRVASCGITLYASEPDCMVNAIVVCSIAPACALIFGSTTFKSGLNSHIFPSTSFNPKEAYGAREVNMAETSGSIFFWNGECFSTSVTKAQRRAIGVPLDGALACPPLLFAVNFTSALPFSKTPTIAKFPGIPPTGSVMIAPPSSHRRNSRIPLRCSSFTSFGAPSPAHSSVQEDARYTSVGGTKPSASSSSTASRKAITVHFVSAVPRPHTLPSAISPEKGA